MKVCRKKYRFVSLLVVLACLASMMVTGVSAADSENMIAVENDEYIMVPIYNSMDEAELAIEQQINSDATATLSATYGTLYPYLARASASSTTVYFNIAYSGSYTPSSLYYSSLKVQNLLNVNYASYGSGTVSFSRTNAYIGSITIPTSASSVLVKGSGLSVKINGTSHAVSPISGTWSIN